MFAKLKEKIQKEGGNVTEVEKTLSPVPGHASPRKVSLTGSPAQSPLSKDRQDGSFHYSSSTEDFSKLDFGSKEDVLAALQKKTDLCKKLECKVAEYTTSLKDSSKKVEKLENFIEKQQDSLAKRTQELNEQYQASRAKMSDLHKEEMEKKEKEKQELLDKLKDVEGIKEKYFKREEEKEEIQQYTTQEMGKLKHMLILKEEEFSKYKTEQDEKLKAIEIERSKLETECSDHGKIVSTLTKERMSLEEQLTECKTQLTEKSSAFSNLQLKYTDLESSHQALVRNSELQKNKLNQQIQEKCDRIEQLEDRVKLLQQREQDTTLSGDDRLIAVEKERDNMERKLTETREQLSQIKSSWSEKISHLEDQISHLNGKIAEDNEELAEARKYTDKVKEKMQKEIDNLHEKLRQSEKQVQEGLDLVNRNEGLHKKEKLELQTEMSKIKLEKVDLDTQLRAKLASVESQLMSLELSKAQEKSRLEEKIVKQEKELHTCHEKLTKIEEHIKTMEENEVQLQSKTKDLQSGNERLKDEIHHKDKQLLESNSLNHSLQEEVRITQEKLDKALKNSKTKSTELQESNKDKDDFMLRNAELSQQLTALQQTSSDEKLSLEEEKKTLENELKSKTQSEQELQEKCADMEVKIQELSNQQSDSYADNMLIKQLQENVTSLEEQVADKNKALKKQEQRLNDLKKTLQRELKVQSLPNDEPIDPKVMALTPPLPRKNSLTRGHHDHTSRNQRMTTHERSPLPNDSVFDAMSESNNSIGTQDYFVGDSSSLGQGHRLNFGKIPHSAKNNHATIMVNDSHGAYSSHGSSGHSRTTSAQGFDMRHLEKDINFQYLKHVVMKFMLSREHEAIQLIKAVSLLLRFTPEEQKLIRDTLEWKMSWFGGSQPPAVIKGHSNKIVPPSW
ncbi:GRIP domain [Mactra antiquata]